MFRSYRPILEWTSKRCFGWRCAFLGCCMLRMFLIGWVLFLVPSPSVSEPASRQELNARMASWNQQAFACTVPSTGGTFPTKQSGEVSQPCDDGDMTLFNGLLCASGDLRGCAGVADAQDLSTGQWFRSPRIRALGSSREATSFSPDMALGTQLYLVAARDSGRGEKWLAWLESIVPCAVEFGGTCILRGHVPRFCTNDGPERGCTMRPGDAAQLASTVDFLQSEAGLGKLRDGRLRGYLGTFGGASGRLIEINARWNRPGYSQHLVGVEIFLMRLKGLGSPSLDQAALELQSKNPGNAFYSYLAEGPSQRVLDELLARCPPSGVLTQEPRRQWQWER